MKFILVQDSALVANLDPSVKIYNGSPATVYSSASLNVYGSLAVNTKVLLADC